MCSHQPQYTTYNNAADTDMHSKMPGCCLMVPAASTIQAIQSSSESTGDA